VDVLYDVANLGLSFGTELTRTGIFRVTESLVNEVLAHPAINARFAALGSWVSEVQLARYDRSVHGLLGNRRVSAWTHSATTAGDSIDLLDRLLEGGDGGQENPSRIRLRAELGLLNRTARPQPIPGAFDVYHSMRQPLVGPDRVAARVRVATIHDMVPSLFPDVTEERIVALHDAVVRSIDVERDWVLCVSHSTRADVRAVTGMPDERIFVVPLAASPGIFRPEEDESRLRAVLARYGIDEGRYVLSLCTLEPRKNLPRLVNAFAAISGEPRNRDVRLVLVGAVGWKSEPLFERIRAHRLPAERMLLTGFVPDEDLSALYSGAAAFVYPSLYEGFGLPALEAMQCGTPVITSDTSSLPEVVGDAALTTDPLDERALSQAMQDVLDDTGLADRLRHAGLERARSFTWRRTVDEILRAYEQMLARTT
jgi:glycosyltransferase involved in cell wall biosynthesis